MSHELEKVLNKIDSLKGEGDLTFRRCPRPLSFHLEPGQGDENQGIRLRKKLEEEKVLIAASLTSSGENKINSKDGQAPGFAGTKGGSQHR